MHQADVEFLDKYKQLESLLRDMLHPQQGSNGVTEYINIMESTPYREQISVSNWDETYKELKHLRWVRNQIAHKSSSLPFSDEEDTVALNDFYESIMQLNDPIASIEKLKKEHHAPKRTIAHRDVDTKQYSTESKGISPISIVAVIALILAVIYLFGKV